MSITTTSTLAPAVQKHFNMKLLAVDDPTLIHSIPANKHSMPANSGNIMRFRGYKRLPKAPVPLGNSGQAPPPENLAAIDIDAKIQFYGSYIYISDQVTLQNQDPVLNSATERLGVQRLETEDELIRDIISQTATQIYCTGGQNGDNPTNLSGLDIDETARTLLGNNARMFISGKQGENKFGSAPIRSAYFGMCHTDLTPTLNNLANFRDKWSYPNQNDTFDSEWGSYNNVRFLVSSEGKKTPNASAKNNTVYDIIITGMESYSIIDQDEYSSSMIYRSPMYSNALALYSSIGWKMAFAARITHDKWLARLRCTL